MRLHIRTTFTTHYAHTLLSAKSAHQSEKRASAFLCAPIVQWYSLQCTDSLSPFLPRVYGFIKSDLISFLGGISIVWPGNFRDKPINHKQLTVRASYNFFLSSVNYSVRLACAKSMRNLNTNSVRFDSELAMNEANEQMREYRMRFLRLFLYFFFLKD